MKNYVIGMIDSGLGGLSIWESVHSLMPKESICYVADHEFIPYGEKSIPFIKKRIIALIGYLTANRVKIIVIACNTATVAGIGYYRKIYPDIPIIGVVPVIKTAAGLTKTKRFAVLSTDFTAKSAYQNKLIRQFASDCRVYTIGCSDLVMLVEKGKTQLRDISKMLKQPLQYIKKNSIDVLILGCTHFSFLRDRIRDIVGSEVQIIDSAPAVARHVERILAQNGLLNNTNHTHYTFLTTGREASVDIIASKLLNRHVKFEHANI